VSSIARTLLICCKSLCAACHVPSLLFAMAVDLASRLIQLILIKLFSFVELDFDQIDRFSRHGAVIQTLNPQLSRKMCPYRKRKQEAAIPPACVSKSSIHSVCNRFKQWS